MISGGEVSLTRVCVCALSGRRMCMVMSEERRAWGSLVGFEKVLDRPQSTETYSQLAGPLSGGIWTSPFDPGLAPCLRTWGKNCFSAKTHRNVLECSRPGKSQRRPVHTPTTLCYLRLWSAGLCPCLRSSCHGTWRSSTPSTRGTWM